MKAKEMRSETSTRDRETAARYTNIAKDYSQDWRGKLTPDLRDQVTVFCNYLGPAPKKILDAGCGTGKISTYLAELGYEVTGLDLSQGMLNETVKNAAEKRVEVKPVLANMRQQPIASASLDAIWNMAALVHLDSAGKATTISEYQRILKPDGILHLSVQNLLHKKHLKRILQSYLYWLGYDENNEFYQHHKSPAEIFQGLNIIARFFQGYAYLDDRHWFFPTKAQLTTLLTQNDFEILASNQVLAKRSSIYARKTK